MFDDPFVREMAGMIATVLICAFVFGLLGFGEEKEDD